MKKILLLALSIITALSFAACGTDNSTAVSKSNDESKENSEAIGNPWSDWDSIEEAEKAVGFPFGLPETVADFKAEVFRTMNDEMIEIIYKDGDYEVCVRKVKGEEIDCSGDYNTFDNEEKEERDNGSVTTFWNDADSSLKQLVSNDGFSWSLASANGYPGDSNADFLNLIFDL